MITIDLRSKPDPGPAIAFAAKARDHRVVVVAELPRDAVVVEGHHYVGKVGVTTDPERIPPPRPRPKRPEPTLAEVRSQRTADLQQQIRDHVDQHLPPQEREALSGLLQSTMLRRSEGLAVDPFAMMALLAALDWAEQALVWANTLALEITEAPDLAAVQAVSAETAIAALKPPPVVTAGEIATALRRTPPES